jgi:hypothetical protein
LKNTKQKKKEQKKEKTKKTRNPTETIKSEKIGPKGSRSFPKPEKPKLPVSMDVESDTFLG